jgi:hypothetical protein
VKRIVCSVILGLVFSASFAEPPSSLHYYGDGYVANGSSETVTSDLGYDFSLNSTPSRNNVSFVIDNFASVDPADAQWYLLYFAAPLGTDLAVGTYSDATRAPFQLPDVPGLWFAGNGRGSNSITGSFSVLDISFSGDTLTSLAVDFVQNEEDGYLGQSFGSLRYHSLVPITTAVPEPATAFLMAAGLCGALIRRTRRSRLLTHHESRCE